MSTPDYPEVSTPAKVQEPKDVTAASTSAAKAQADKNKKAKGLAASILTQKGGTGNGLAQKTDATGKATLG